MPPQGRPQSADGRDRGGEASLDERRLREALARQSQAQAPRQQASYRATDPRNQAEWDDTDWDGDS